MKHFLSTDIVSVFNRRRYGSAGDEVSIISDHGGILIVQGPDNNRYAVTSFEIRTDRNSADPPVTLELILLPPESKVLPKPKSKTKKEQASLF